MQVPLAEGAGALVQPVERRAARPVVRDRIVLLVENDEDLRRAMVLLLEKWGVSVLDAAGGEEALALIEEIGILPDCLLVDQQLGQRNDGDGFPAPLPDIARCAAGAAGHRRPRAGAGGGCAALGVDMMHKPIDAAGAGGIPERAAGRRMTAIRPRSHSEAREFFLNSANPERITCT